jgi:hypothetical protein
MMNWKKYLNANRIKMFCLLHAFVVCAAFAQREIRFRNDMPVLVVDGREVASVPEEGLWSVAAGWQNDWMADWRHASPSATEKSGEWTIVKGQMELQGGTLLLRDAYRITPDSLLHCVRRYEWQGTAPLQGVTLSVRWKVAGAALRPFLPGILYYGNKNGAKVNDRIIPVYSGAEGELAVFEEHRYPMPFAMLEDNAGRYAVALHTTPSPVRGARRQDQWWSMGVEAQSDAGMLVLYSGPIGYNRRHSIAKALQQTPMAYTDTYIDMEPGQVIEKEFVLEAYPVSGRGTGFQRPIYTSLDRFRPYDADRFPSFDEIVQGKYRFSKSRWMELGGEAVGYNMYDMRSRKAVTMGWCGQADSPGYYLQMLGKRLADDSIPDKIQRSLDFLSTSKVNPENGLFPVIYADGKWQGGGDPVSCGQAMYNFAKAIECARKGRKYDTRKWEDFLQAACRGVSHRILSDSWNPVSTNEGFYIAPLAIASRLFKERTFRQAAEKAAALYADRHLKMDGCYWGGTLDATCEDKEGAWAAFQGFLELYERLGEKKYLQWAKHAMDVCLSYVVVWDIPLPAGRMADHNFKSTGWTVVSAQNQHIDVYGVLFAPEVYKMGRYLKDDRLCRLAKVMYRTCYQLTDAYGSQGEQLQHTNFAQRGHMDNVYKLRGGYSENWTVFWITAHFLNAAARFTEMGVEP